MAELKHYHVKWADGRETTVKLDEDDVKNYRKAGAEVTAAPKLAPVKGPVHERATEQEERLRRESGSEKAATPDNKAAQPASNK